MTTRVKRIKEKQDYSDPFRPNYERKIATGWSASTIGALATSFVAPLPAAPLWAIAAFSAGMALYRLPAAIKLHALQKNLAGRPLEFINTEDLFEISQKQKDKLWLGTGFNWEQIHTQRMHQVLTRNISDLIEADDSTMGAPWIHGLEPDESPIFQMLAHAGLHTLVLGATGSGKTRMADLLISQAIWRDEAVIIIDPKGDKDTQANARAACEFMGKPEKYVSFHPAFAHQSHRINPLQNYTRASELGGRVVAKMPGDGQAGSFKAYSQDAVNAIVQGMIIAGERPTIRAIKTYIDGRIHDLTIRAIIAYSNEVLGHQRTEAFVDTLDMSKPATAANNLIKFYYSDILPVKEHSGLQDLMSQCQHDKAHFGKMIATLKPILSMLSADELGDLLSPDPNDASDDRPITSSKQIVENRKVAYLGLDSLSDQMVGQTIGSMFLADITSVAGEKYNYDPEGCKSKPINLFIDEAAEVSNDQLIQILNKSRGAGFRVTIFTQSISDFEAAMGSPAKMKQVLDNLNNLISLRIVGNDTQEYFTKNIPEVTVASRQEQTGTSTKEDPSNFGGSVGERIMEERVPMLAPQVMGMLPNLEFVAKLSGSRLIKGRIPILQKGDPNSKKALKLKKQYVTSEDIAA